MATEPVRTYPSELPVLALRQTVVFPLTLQPLSINRPMSIDAVNRALAGDRLTFAVLTSLYLAIAIPWEERSLVAAFGDAYRRYQQQVRWRMIPFIY